MSTRCQIGFYEDEKQDILKPTVLLYKHSDGYPDGVLPIISPFIAKFIERRGWDDEYFPAWLIYKLIEAHVAHNKEFSLRLKDESICPKDGEDCIGYGICKDFHGDIEYFYRIDPTGIKVYETRFPWDDKPITRDCFSEVPSC